jgi:hypothetical protein
MLDLLKRHLYADAAIDRRGLMSAALAAPVLIGPSAAQAANPIRSEFRFFADDAEAFRAHFRFERDLVDAKGETVTWYHFVVYAVADGVRPVPFVRFEGLEYSYFRRLAPLTYRIHAHNLSFPRDLATGAWTDTAVNPITGATVDVPPTVLTEDPGVIDSPKGYVTLDSKDGVPFKGYAMYRIEGDLIRREHIRAAPAGWPTMFIESSTAWVDLATFDDPRFSSLPIHTSGFYVAPWPKWMAMGDRPGHMIGVWTGRKLGSAAELPAEYVAHAKSSYPNLLNARWSEFDRPLTVKH